MFCVSHNLQAPPFRMAQRCQKDGVVIRRGWGGIALANLALWYLYRLLSMSQRERERENSHLTHKLCACPCLHGKQTNNSLRGLQNGRGICVGRVRPQWAFFLEHRLIRGVRTLVAAGLHFTRPFSWLALSPTHLDVGALHLLLFSGSGRAGALFAWLWAMRLGC
ncbi:hypothetical protein BX600DRAFT_213295 [Xylariales sp. PMI_506]|nr:hypothetical protein BX600DRAFT_213295 [Xylariales sp. PMI_506]